MSATKDIKGAKPNNFLNDYRTVGGHVTWVNQNETASRMTSAVLNGNRRLLLAARCQAGKTGAVICFIEQLLAYCPDGVVLCHCNKPDVSIKGQNHGIFELAFPKIVLHSATFNLVPWQGKILNITYADLKPDFLTKLKSYVEMRVPITLVVDESHYASVIEGTYEKLLNAAGVDLNLDSLEWANQNITILTVSASPNQELLSEVENPKTHVVKLESGPNYTGAGDLAKLKNFVNTDSQNYFNANKDGVSQFYNEQSDRLLLEIKNNPKAGAIIVHRETDHKLTPIMKEHWESKGVRVIKVGCPTANKQADMTPREAENILRLIDLEEPIVFLIDQCWSAGTTIEDTNILAWFEKVGKVKDEVALQRMRLCGNNRNPEVFYFMSSSTLKTVEHFYTRLDYCIENKVNDYIALASTHASANITETNVNKIIFSDVKPEGQALRSVEKNMAIDLAEEIRNGRLRNVAGKGCVVIDGAAKNADRSFDRLIADMKAGLFEDRGLTPQMVKNLLEKDKPIYAVGIKKGRQLTYKEPKTSKKAYFPANY